MVDQPVRSMSDLCTITPGTRVRVAHGVFGQLGTVRAVSPGHLMVRLDSLRGAALSTATRHNRWDASKSVPAIY